MTCYQYLKYNDQLEQYKPKRFKKVTLIPAAMYDLVEQWIELGPLNSTGFWQYFKPMDTAETAKRYFERMKQILTQVGIQFSVYDNGRMVPVTNREDLHERSYARVDSKGRYAHLGLDRLRKRLARRLANRALRCAGREDEVR